MGFWGIEVKPGKPYPYHSDNVPGRLHVTQATLGLGSSTDRSIVQCSIGHKSPIFLCSLLPNKNESCPLNLEFDDDDLVAFSVIGPRSVHLSGYFEAIEGDGIRDDYESDSYGEDIAETETEESSDYYSSGKFDDEYTDDEEDDDFAMFPPSPVRNSGVVIEEIVDDEKPTNGNGQSKRQKKKNQANDSEDKKNSQNQIVVRGETGVPVLESEDEDGFPTTISNVQKPEAEVKSTDDRKEKTKKKKAQDGDGSKNLKRKVENIDQEGRPEKEKKKKKKKQQLKGQAGDDNSNEEQPEELKSSNLNQASPKMDEHEEELANEKSLDSELEQVLGESRPEEEKKKKKKNKKKIPDNEEGTNSNQTVTAKEDKNRSTSDSEPKHTDSKSSNSKVRTFPNGLVIEELAMGKPDGKRASPGKNVSVHYIGKLKKNGKIFDSNVGRAPFKFRLGLGQVISGWDVGVKGMRVGDKRRLTIPPAMGYGSRGAGGKIPPNSWLVFDVELIDVR